jgi:soluble epoxide hydrolase/lipid-phosphate phosphatase
LGRSRHDWGSTACWEAGRVRPDIFSGVVSLTVPVSGYLPRNAETTIHNKLKYLASAGLYAPIEAFVTAFPKLTYQIYFRDKIDSAVAELEVDVRRTIRVLYRESNTVAPDAFLTSSTSFLTPYDGTEVRQESRKTPPVWALNCGAHSCPVALC